MDAWKYISVGIGMAIVLAGCSDKKKSDDAAAVVPTVDVARPVTDSIVISKTYPAYLASNNTIEVVARVNGYIKSSPFSEGQKVTKGQVLYTIENTQYRDAVNEAQADLATAQSQFDYASRQYQAMKKALESDAVSQMDVVKAEQAMNQAKASIASAQARLQTAQTNLGYCTVRALADGHVATSGVSVGDYVSGEGAPVTLTTIYEDGLLCAEFSIDEATFARLSRAIDSSQVDIANIPVTFEDPSLSTTGHIAYIAPDIDVSTGTMALKVDIPNIDGRYKSGMYATVHLPLGSIDHALLVTDASIGTDQLGKYLYIVNDSDKVVYTPIKTGEIINDSMRVITSGIAPESRYVTKALLKVHDGMKVNPVDASRR